MASAQHRKKVYRFEDSIATDKQRDYFRNAFKDIQTSLKRPNAEDCPVYDDPKQFCMQHMDDSIVKVLNPSGELKACSFVDRLRFKLLKAAVGG